MIRLAAAFAVAATTLAAPPASAQNEDRPLLTRADDGSFEARFAGGCRAAYDASGNRTGARGCSDIEIGNADAMVLAQVGIEGGALQLERTSRGGGRVTFEGGCLVTYNKTGRRSGSQGCKPQMVQRADRYVQRNWNN